MSSTQLTAEYADTVRAQEQALRRSRKQEREKMANTAIFNAAGTAPRAAKTKALADPVWLGAEGKGKRRKTAPSTDDVMHEPRAAGTTNHGHGSDSDAGDERRVPQQASRPVNATPARPKPAAKPKKSTIPRHRAVEPESESSHLTSSESGSEDEKASEGGDEDDSEAEEEDDGLVGMPESHLEELMVKEGATIITRSNNPHKVANDTQSLFNIDNEDVEMASNHSRSGSRYSSSASRPATSESEGTGLNTTFDTDDCADSDDDDNKPFELPARRKAVPKDKINDFIDDEDEGVSRAPKRKATKQDIRLKQERLQISTQTKSASVEKTEKAKNAKKVKTSSDVVKPAAKQSWPEYTDVVDGGLTKQSPLIRVLCRDAIRILEGTLITKEAWPELHRASDYRVEVFSAAARALEKKDARYRDFRKRIGQDEDYASAVGEWIADRLPLARGPARAHALNEIAVFQLGVGADCSIRVAALFLNKTYVYPGQWGTDSKGAPIWVVKGRDMYQNPAITNVLRSAYFGSISALGFKFRKHYISSCPDMPNERELTIPLVALAATGVHAALYAWKSGQYNKADNKTNKFSGELFKTVYQHHVRSMEKLKQKHVKYFHKTMAAIYTAVVGPGDQDDSDAEQGDPMAVLDLTGLDDEEMPAAAADVVAKE